MIGRVKRGVQRISHSKFSGNLTTHLVNCKSAIESNDYLFRDCLEFPKIIENASVIFLANGCEQPETYIRGKREHNQRR